MPKPFARGWRTDTIIPEELDIGARSITYAIIHEEPTIAAIVIPRRLGWLERVTLSVKRATLSLKRLIELPPSRHIVPIALHIDAVVYHRTSFIRRLIRL